MRKKKIWELQRLDVEAFKRVEKIPLVIVLDDVRSMHNVGSVFRTADAFRVEKIYLCGITGRPPHSEIHKTALGAEDSVDWEYRQSALQVVRELTDAGYVVYAVEQAENSVSLPDFELNKGLRYAVVLGNEVKGVSQEVVDSAMGCIEIPQYGTKHSLNVSVAAGIVIYSMASMLNGNSLLDE